MKRPTSSPPARSAPIHMGSVQAGARLDRLPIGRFHRRILWLIGAGMFLDAFDIYLQGGVLGALVHDGWSTPDINATFLSCTFLGMLVGAAASGVVGDRFGRRVTYQINLAIFGIASMAAVFAPSMTVLIALRFVMGIGLGAEIVVGYATISEFIPPERRGRWVGLLSMLTNLAVTATGLLGFVVIPTIGWRAMFAIVGVGAIVVWFLRKEMPESPRWLESRGRLAEADALLLKIEEEAGGVASLPPLPPLPAVPETGVPDRITYLFSPKMIRRTLLGVTVGVTMPTALYGFNGWLPTFLVKQGHGVVATLGFTAVMGLGAPLGAWMGAILADRWGRRPGIIALSLVWATAGVGYAFAASQLQIMALGFCVVVGAYALNSICYAIYIPELFPTRLRLRGASIAGAAGRLASAGAQYGVVWAFAAGGIGAVAACLAGLLVLQAAIIALFGVETKQRSLEDLSSPPASGAVPLPLAPGWTS